LIRKRNKKEKKRLSLKILETAHGIEAVRWVRFSEFEVSYKNALYKSTVIIIIVVERFTDVFRTITFPDRRFPDKLY